MLEFLGFPVEVGSEFLDVVLQLSDLGQGIE